MVIRFAIKGFVEKGFVVTGNHQIVDDFKKNTEY